MKQLQHFFKDKTVRQILDVGCGSGDFIKVIRHTFDEQTQITGIDPGEQWLKEARARFPQANINFSCMSGETLDFEDASFDVVSLSNALHHLKDLEQTLSEMKRVLKPGGWIIINEVADGDLTEAQENQKMLHHFKSFVDRLHGISHRQTWKPEEILAIIEHNKLSVIDSFEHLKMKKVNVEPHFLDEKYWQMESLQEELQGRPEYDQTKDQLPVFKERLEQYGFQTAPQLLVLAQAKND